MRNDLVGTCSLTLPGGQAPGRIHLLPFGKVSGRDGRGPYVIRDKAHATRIIATTAAFQNGADIPIDYEHQSQLAPASVAARPAAGWIKWNSLEVRSTGIWGLVEWTSAAAQLLEQRAYRYLSPVFTHLEDGTVLRVSGAALTNFPNLQLTALASQGGTMPGDTLTSAKTLLGLDTADDSTFLKAIGDLAKLAKAFIAVLGLPPDTDLPGLLDALLQKADAAPDTSIARQDAAMMAITAVAHQAETFREKVSQQQVESAVADAMKNGKISPAMRAWATALATQDTNSFNAFLKAMPPIFAGIFRSDFTNRDRIPSKDGPENGLNDVQLAVCRQMGIAPEDYRKNMEG